MTKVSPAFRMGVMKWHRRLTLILVLQLAVWLTTALTMTLIPRSGTTAYRAPPPAALDAPAGLPDLTLLETVFAGGGVSILVLETQGSRTVVAADNDLLVNPVTGSALVPINFDEAAAIASQITGEPVAVEAVSLKTANSPEYQKRPVPALRVEADKAVLFLDPVTGALIDQTTPLKHLENWATTIHIMDYTGKGVAQTNLLLTFFALLFLSAAVSGVITTRRLYIRHKAGLRSMKLHQLVGLVLAIQVVFWVTSGLSVVWLLHPSRDFSGTLEVPAPAIDWSRVNTHPRDIAFGNETPPTRLILTSLLGEPVWRAQWPGRNPPRSSGAPRMDDG